MKTPEVVEAEKRAKEKPEVGEHVERNRRKRASRKRRGKKQR